MESIPLDPPLLQSDIDSGGDEYPIADTELCYQMNECPLQKDRCVRIWGYKIPRKQKQTLAAKRIAIHSVRISPVIFIVLSCVCLFVFLVSFRDGRTTVSCSSMQFATQTLCVHSSPGWPDLKTMSSWALPKFRTEFPIFLGKNGPTSEVPLQERS